MTARPRTKKDLIFSAMASTYPRLTISFRYVSSPGASSDKSILSMPPLFQLNGLAFHDAKLQQEGIGANGRR